MDTFDRWAAEAEGTTWPTAGPMPTRWRVDPVSGGHVADRLAERLPTVPLLRLEDVGHWPPLEAPDETAAAVRELVG